MSEEARPYRHTAGEWGPHKSYKIEHKSIENDDGSVRVYADAYIASGDKIIAEVQMRTGNCGWPHVENMVEFKANVALMSAAPNMLDVLDRIRGMDRNEYRLPPMIYDLIESAIAKATKY